MRRPQNFVKSLPYFCLQYIQTKVRWRFRKLLWPSQNIRTLFTLCDFKGARSIGSVQVDLFDKFNIGQKINKGHEKWIGYLATLTCWNYVGFYLKNKLEIQKKKRVKKHLSESNSLLNLNRVNLSFEFHLLYTTL